MKDAGGSTLHFVSGRKELKKAETPLTDIVVGNCVRKGNELSHDCHDSCHEI